MRRKEAGREKCARKGLETGHFLVRSHPEAHEALALDVLVPIETRIGP